MNSLLIVRIVIISLVWLNTESSNTSFEIDPCECDPFASFVKYCGADGKTYDGCQIKCQKPEVVSVGRCTETEKQNLRNQSSPKYRFKEPKLILGKNISVVYK